MKIFNNVVLEIITSLLEFKGQINIKTGSTDSYNLKQVWFKKISSDWISEKQTVQTLQVFSEVLIYKTV